MSGNIYLLFYSNTESYTGKYHVQSSLRIYWRLIFGNIIRCFTLWLWVGYFIYFKITPVCSFNACFLWMFFNSVKDINMLTKEINRLLSKGRSNIYLKVTIEKKWNTQNFDFLRFKSLSPVQFLGISNSCRYHWIFKLLIAT